MCIRDRTSSKDLGKEISLADYKGRWLVFFFYPLDFTFVCPTEITALSDRSDEFKAVDCDIVGASTDSVFSHWAWINTPREKNGIADLKDVYKRQLELKIRSGLTYLSQHKRHSLSLMRGER